MSFSYDPFDPEVMANPLPYYRILRDLYPAYYMPQWDTFALSRFEDIWQVLEVNDGTFVATEGTLPPASVISGRRPACFIREASVSWITSCRLSMSAGRGSLAVGLSSRSIRSR